LRSSVFVIFLIAIVFVFLVVVSDLVTKIQKDRKFLLISCGQNLYKSNNNKG
jgi:hypothetical protein